MGAFPDNLNSTVRRISDLTRSTESEFLGLGDRLQEMVQRSRDASGKASGVASMMSGADLASAIERLQAVHTAIGDAGGAGLNSERLASVLESFREIPRRLDSLARTVRILEMVGFLVKVEDARLTSSDTGFTTVAQNLQALGREIRSKSEDLRSRSSLIAASLERSLRTISENERQLNQGAGVIMERVLGSLGSLRNKHQRSTGVLTAISSRFRAISESIGEVIVSLQFHDITRQRIEHAIEALGKVESFPREFNPEESEHAHEVADICRLQAAQLQHAMDDLRGAVARIRKNLLALVEGEHAISRDTLELAGARSGEKTSFLAGIEGEMISLERTFADYERISGETAAAMKTVLGLFRDMSSFATDITSMGVEMKFVAMNASINAARIGERGVSLGVLAISTQEMAQQTSDDISAISGSLTTIFSAGHELSTTDAPDGDGQSDGVSDLTGRIKSVRSDLHSVDGKIRADLAEIDEIGKGLSGEVTQAAKSFSSPETLAAEIGRFVEELQTYADRMGTGAPGGRRGGGLLETLQSSYTMQSERDVHRSHAGATVSQQENRGQDSLGDGLGDNVELF